MALYVAMLAKEGSQSDEKFIFHADGQTDADKHADEISRILGQNVVVVGEALNMIDGTMKIVDIELP